MTDLEELILTADRLCNTLSCVAAKEHQFVTEICDELEMMSWQSYMIANNLKTIQAQVSHG